MEKYIREASEIMALQGALAPYNPKTLLLLALISFNSSNAAVDILDSEAVSEAKSVKIKQLSTILSSVDTTDAEHRSLIKYFVRRDRGVQAYDQAYKMINQLDDALRKGTESDLFTEKGSVPPTSADSIGKTQQSKYIEDRKGRMNDSLRVGNDILAYLEGAFTRNDSVRKSIKEQQVIGRRVKAEVNASNNKIMLDQASDALRKFYSNAVNMVRTAWE